MPLRSSWQPDETTAGGGDATNSRSKFTPARVAKAKSIEATARILRPTRSSQARATKKRLTGEAKEKAEARKVERKRRLLARVTKQNGRLTIPQSPKFHSQSNKRKSLVSKLTMTSRELVEIEAIKKRVQEMRKKTQKYHEATTRSVLSSSSGATTKSSFAMALRSCGGLGVPAVRRAKLTQPIGFEFEIDKRLDARKRTSSSSSTASTISLSSQPEKTASGSTQGPTKRLRL